MIRFSEESADDRISEIQDRVTLFLERKGETTLERVFDCCMFADYESEESEEAIDDLVKHGYLARSNEGLASRLILTEKGRPA